MTVLPLTAQFAKLLREQAAARESRGEATGVPELSLLADILDRLPHHDPKARALYSVKPDPEHPRPFPGAETLDLIARYGKEDPAEPATFLQRVVEVEKAAAFEAERPR